MFKKLQFSFFQSNFLTFNYLLKWLLVSVVIGLLVGASSALFLITLEAATHFRVSNSWLVWYLPLGGFFVGWLYHRFGQKVAGGNNLLIRTIQNPQTEKISFRMAPMVYVGTLVTHFLGGSAGREGTALQMAAAICDPLTRLFKFTPADRKMVLIASVAAGFGSVFGTPLAGMLFALEFCVVGKIRYQALLPTILSAVIAHWFCTAIGARHTQYHIPLVPEIRPIIVLYAALVGVICGLVAKLFSESMHFLTGLFAKAIVFPPLRPLIGGSMIALLFLLFAANDYMGLGIPVIQKAFVQHLLWYAFLLKILFTVLTLSAGFKGGEVTPLFFIGATLGNALSYFVPLPMPLLAGMGFVAVFAGATHTPLACMIMAIELFGVDCGVYVAIACVIAHFCSGASTIYPSQLMKSSH